MDATPLQDSFASLYAEQAQNVLGAILDQSVECIKLLNLRGELEYINPNGLRALGVTDFALLSGRAWPSLWPEDGRARIEAALDRAQRGQRDRFDGFCPDFAGQPRWWDVSVAPIYDDRRQLTHILATSRDISNHVLERAQEKHLREEAERLAERSDSVAREMRHRLKNQLAVVSSVAKLLSRHSRDAGDLMDRLEGKLQSLARAQDLLTVHRAQPPEAAHAIAQVLEASGAGDRIEVGLIPYARLGDEGIQQIALILGELQTNSLKYGALMRGQGKIQLSGALANQVLTISWHEDCGCDIEPPQEEGSGLKLFVRLGSVSGRNASVRWHRRGPLCEFHIRVV